MLHNRVFECEICTSKWRFFWSGFDWSTPKFKPGRLVPFGYSKYRHTNKDKHDKLAYRNCRISFISENIIINIVAMPMQKL